MNPYVYRLIYMFLSRTLNYTRSWTTLVSRCSNGTRRTRGLQCKHACGTWLYTVVSISLMRKSWYRMGFNPPPPPTRIRHGTTPWFTSRLQQVTMNTEIPLHLIEKALAFTGKTEWAMAELTSLKQDGNDITTKWKFSIEKFCYYLISPSFIEKYTDTIAIRRWYDVSDKFLYEHEYDYNAGDFWKSIRKYQSWNPQPLISLLEKI